MSGAFDDQKLGLGGNQLSSGFDFVDRAEGIAGAMDEQSRRMKPGQMLGAWLIGPAGSMQRVGKKQQAVGDIFFGNKHAGLATAVTLPAEEDTVCSQFSQNGDGIFQAFAVASGVAGARRTEFSQLAKWQVAAENGESRCGKSFCERDQECRLRVAACSVSKNQAIARRGWRPV